MKQVAVNGQNYQIHNLFEEVQMRDLSMLYGCEGERKILEHFSDISGELISKMWDEQVDTLMAVFDWEVENLNPVSWPLPFDIEDESYEKLEELKSTLLASGSFWYAAPQALEIYEMEFDYDEPAEKYLGHASALYIQLNDFLSNFKDLTEGNEPDDTEIAAGFESLASFGSFGTLYHLAGGDPTRYEAILKLPAYDVYETLRYKKVLNAYQENYRNLKELENGSVSETHSNPGKGSPKSKP